MKDDYIFGIYLNKLIKKTLMSILHIISVLIKLLLVSHVGVH